MTIRAIVFDYGGTLVTGKPAGFRWEIAGIEQSAKCLFDSASMQMHYIDAMKAAYTLSRRVADDTCVEIPMKAIVTSVLYGMSIFLNEVEIQFVEEMIFEPETRLSRLLPSAIETLSWCNSQREIKCCIASNYCSHVALVNSVLGKGIEHYFDSISSSCCIGFRKPDARFFNHMSNLLRLDAASIAFIGDDKLCDGWGSEQAGMHPIVLDSLTTLEMVPRIVGDMI